MQSAITALIDAARSHFGAKPSISPVESQSSTAPTRSILPPAPTAPIFMDITMPRLFIRSPLTANPGLTPGEIDRLCAIYADKNVLRAAAELRANRERAAEFAEFRAGIAEAIVMADHDGITVIEALNRLIKGCSDEIDLMRADRQAHDAVANIRVARLQSLVVAVGDLSARACTERQMIGNRIQAMTSSRAGIDAPVKRYAALQAEGLTNEQINALGYSQSEDRDLKIQAFRKRLAEIDRVLAQCAAFGADPLKSAHHLDGLGLDNLIEAQRVAAEPVPS